MLMLRSRRRPVRRRVVTRLLYRAAARATRTCGPHSETTVVQKTCRSSGFSLRSVKPFNGQPFKKESIAPGETPEIVLA